MIQREGFPNDHVGEKVTSCLIAGVLRGERKEKSVGGVRRRDTSQKNELSCIVLGKVWDRKQLKPETRLGKEMVSVGAAKRTETAKGKGNDKAGKKSGGKSLENINLAFKGKGKWKMNRKMKESSKVEKMEQNRKCRKKPLSCP